MSETLGLKNINMLSKEQYENIEQPAHDELYVVSHSGIGFPSSNYDDLELGASGTTYTAPANGWYNIVQTTSSSNNGFCTINLKRGEVVLFTVCYSSPNSTNSQGGLIPVIKGDKLYISYDRASFRMFRFIYAEGE